MSKKDSDAVDKILKYMEQQNRPYSVNDIFLNLHKEIGKTLVQKALDTLVQHGTIKEKTYGKQKVYVADQDKFAPVDDAKLKEMDARINELSEELKSQSKCLQDAESTLRSLENSLTTEEALRRISEIELEVDALEEKLSNLKNKQVVITQQEKERIEQKHVNMLKEWKKRKRMTLDILDAILEGYPKSKKELFEQIGIETDEDVGVSMPKN